MFDPFLVIGATILLGYFSIAFFDRTKISQVILLMLFGFILAHVLGVVDASNNSVIISILPFLSTLALIILLFDAGLTFDVVSVAKSIPRSFLFTLTIFFFTMLIITLVLWVFFGWPLLYGALLAAVLGGTSSAIVVAMIEKTRLDKETKSMLVLESTITDAFCIIFAVFIAQLIALGSTPDFGILTGSLANSIFMSIVFGTVSAILWLVISKRFLISKFSYMLTLSIIFILYAVTTSSGFNGGLAVFVFGIIIGNISGLLGLVNIKWGNRISPTIQFFQGEITFFIRTFFFVYIGLLISPDYFQFPIVIFAAFLTFLFIVSRSIVSKFFLPSINSAGRNMVVAMMPRGLAAAVLTTLPLIVAVPIPDFRELVFVTLLFTNIVATLGVILFDYSPPDDESLSELEEKDSSNVDKVDEDKDSPS
ncbi:MAG: cation:proton antiporter [Candidatus Micrarchaeota archaeon]